MDIASLVDFGYVQLISLRDRLKHQFGHQFRRSLWDTSLQQHPIFA